MGTLARGFASLGQARVGTLMLLGVVLGISSTAALPAPTVADSSSDIPGVPLSPGVVVGPLGGSTFDAVYRLDVAPGSVILASLTGSAGTDFDLYLFDGSATTVVTNQGVVAKSTGPTSTEFFSYATALGGRFYVDLNSASAAVGTYTLAVQVIHDRAPVATLALGAGHSRTSSTTVAVSLTASGSLSGPALMAFSGDGIAWQAWLPYQAVTSWTFPNGDGTKALWAKVKNAAGVASAPVSASIALDTQPPSVAAVDPVINADLVGALPTIAVTFSEPIDPASWTLLGLLVQTPDGVLVPGVFSVTAPAVGTFRPSEDLVVGGAYVLTVGAVRDLAGNVVAPVGSWLAVDRQAPEITLQGSPAIVDRGATAVLRGRVTAPAGVGSLALEAQASGALTTVILGSVTVGVDGSFSARVTPSSTTEYLLRLPASGDFAAGTASALVSVRRSVRLNWSDAVVHAGRIGTRVTIVASVNPVASGIAVAYRVERWSAVSRSWGLVGTFSRRTDSAGRASLSWVPSGSALYRWRATAGSTADYFAGSSQWLRWSIGR